MQRSEEYSKFFNPDEEEWHGSSRKISSEEKKLELRLGPPGDQFHGYNTTTATTHGIKRVLQDTSEAKLGEKNWFLDTNGKQCKKLSCPEEEEGERVSWLPDKKPCSSPATASFSGITPVTDGYHKRATLAPVVGWPPVRSFRKNLANSSTSKLASEIQNKTPKPGTSTEPESFRKDLFVKINMEGVPIGRKINLNAYDSYEKLSVAIDELFRGLLSVSISGYLEPKGNAGSLAGSGEYTLVYEDNEGDRILVGDVPWHMFISTAKRLRLLKSSELSTPRLSVGSGEQENDTD